MDGHALRAILQVNGFSNQAATYIVNTQGFNDPEDYVNMTDEDVANVCKVTRRPGGLNDNDDPHPGTGVSVKAEGNLKMMCYYWRHQKRISRPVVTNLATPATTSRLRTLKEAEKEHEDPSPPELTFTNWTRTIDVIEDYLRNCLGKTKIPLAYIIRDQVVPTPHANDDADGYSSREDEMIARAPHMNADGLAHTDQYKEDNIAVFNKLSELMREKDCWTYMRSATRTRDGRMAFRNLKEHYLGRNNVDHLASQAERKLQNTTYSGEARRWNFEKYVRTHVEQHTILEELTRHGYSGIDDRSKVRYLVDGIRTSSLDSVKAQVYASADLRADFQACVNLFKDFLKQSSNARDAARNSNISAIQRENTNGPGKQPMDLSVEDRYYTPREYNKLSLAKKNGLRHKRELRIKKNGGKDPKKKPTNAKHSVKFTKSERRVVAALTKLAIDGDDKDSSDDEGEVTNNRNNRALRRRDE